MIVFGTSSVTDYGWIRLAGFWRMTLSLIRPTFYVIYDDVRRKWTIPNYHRWRIPGGCYFFTVNLLERKKHLLVDLVWWFDIFIITLFISSVYFYFLESITWEAKVPPKMVDFDRLVSLYLFQYELRFLVSHWFFWSAILIHLNWKINYLDINWKFYICMCGVSVKMLLWSVYSEIFILNFIFFNMTK